MQRRSLRFIGMMTALVTVAASGTTAIAAQESGFAPVERVVEDHMRRFFLPSVVISVARNGEIVWERAFGWADIERQRRATPETPYYMASITKSLTATALMTLVERGRVNLDAPANEYLGVARLHSSLWDANQATVRRVASHTSGLPNYWRDCPAPERQTCEPSRDRAIRRYGFLVRPPGTPPFGYSGLGYEILGDLIARQAGTTYAAYVHDAVFRPLGMRGCAMGDEPPPSAARPYNAGNKQPRGAILSSTPAASVSWCSSRDLVRFGTALIGARMKGQRQILTPASIETMFAPEVAAQGMHYALGWWRREDLFGYTAMIAQGGTFDAHTSLYLIPSERIAVAVVANSSHGTLWQTVSEATLSAMLPTFRQRYEAEKTAAAPPAPASAPPATVTTPGTGTWRGVVRTPDGALPVIMNVAPDGGLTMSVSGQPPIPLTQPRSGNVFVGGILKGALPNDDLPSAPPDMELVLGLRDGRLVGTLTMRGVVRDAGFSLPHLVELTRDPPQPQQTAGWKDPSSHVSRLVPVGQDLRLEVLDWGGTGRPLVLLAGGGDTAHVFDDFAPRLTSDFHVYAITRRGFGESEFTPVTSGAHTFGDDVLAVLDALALEKPILVGHSIAGQELSSIGTRRPDRVAALVYLDAGYQYAFDNGKIPTFQDISAVGFPQPPPPTDADLATFDALRQYYARILGFTYPEAELRNKRTVTEQGGVGAPRTPPGGRSLLITVTKFVQIQTPALFLVSSQNPGRWADDSTDPKVRRQVAGLQAVLERQAKAIEEGVPGARVVRLPGANHYVFLSHEADVLREMRAFLAQQ
jgi:non-heme chloroperoxidase